MFPIYIPSKGRAGLQRGAINMLNEAGLGYVVVVEPQEKYLYRQMQIDHLQVLDRNDAGVGYAREYIRQMSKRLEEDFHWQINDDIRGFVFREPDASTVHISPADAIEYMESRVSLYSNIGFAGPNEDLWPPTEDCTKVNANPAQAVLVNNSVPAQFREYPGFEDFDFLLQVLEAGYCSIRFDHIRIAAPTPGTNKGGLFGTDRASWKTKFEAAWPHAKFNPGGSPGGCPSRRWIMKHYHQRPTLINAEQ